MLHACVHNRCLEVWKSHLGSRFWQSQQLQPEGLDFGHVLCCHVLAFWSFPQFSQSCDRSGPSKLFPASGTWMTCLIQTLCSRTRMRSLDSIDSHRQIIVTETYRNTYSAHIHICNTWCALVEARFWQGFVKLAYQDPMAPLTPRTSPCRPGRDDSWCRSG